jgi:hypothetical protein
MAGREKSRSAAKDTSGRLSCGKGIVFSPLPNLPQKRFSSGFKDGIESLPVKGKAKYRGLSTAAANAPPSVEMT